MKYYYNNCTDEIITDKELYQGWLETEAEFKAEFDNDFEFFLYCNSGMGGDLTEMTEAQVAEFDCFGEF